MRLGNALLRLRGMIKTCGSLSKTGITITIVTVTDFLTVYMPQWFEPVYDPLPRRY